MFRLITWLSSGMCITKNGYIEILQILLNKYTDTCYMLQIHVTLKKYFFKTYIKY